MPAVTITPDDLAPFAVIDPVKAAAMIADAMAMAAQAAPCILDDGFAFGDAAKAIIRGAILRWNDAQSGAVTQQSAGPFQFTVDSNTRRNGMFWPSEIRDLRKLCASSAGRQAHVIDMDTTADA